MSFMISMHMMDDSLFSTLGSPHMPCHPHMEPHWVPTTQAERIISLLLLPAKRCPSAFKTVYQTMRLSLMSHQP